VPQAYPNTCHNNTITDKGFDLASVILVTVLCICCQWLWPGRKRVLGGSSAQGICQRSPLLTRLEGAGLNLAGLC